MIFGCLENDLWLCFKEKKKLVSWFCSVHENECMLFHSVFNQKRHWKRDVFSAVIPKYRKIGKISYYLILHVFMSLLYSGVDPSVQETPLR